MYYQIFFASLPVGGHVMNQIFWQEFMQTNDDR